MESAPADRPRLRVSLAGLPAYRAGTAGPAADFKASSNELPVPPSPAVLAAVAVAAAGGNRYPDISSSALARVLADQLGVAADRVAVGTGSVALLQQAVLSVCDAGDEVVFAWRSFEAYPIITRIAGAVPRPVPITIDGRHDLAGMAAAITERTRLVLLCTPNNPTGPALSREEVLGFLATVPPDVLVVLDEAYHEFVTDPAAVDGIDLLDAHPNLCVMRTFSKAYGLAGFRVGYAVAHVDTATALRSTGVPFGVSALAQAAALAACQEQDLMRERVRAVCAERERAIAGLAGHGITVPQAQGNFVWFGAGAAAEELAAHLESGGLAVRTFPGDGVRVTIAEPAATTRLLELIATSPRRGQGGEG